MRRRLAIPAAILALASIVAATGCDYPDFMFRTSGTGGAATSSTTSSSSATASASAGGGGMSASATSASSAASSGSGGGLTPCPIGHLVISEVRTRGPGGASDEFVELYNPTEAPIPLDGTWMLDAHTLDVNVKSYSPRWSGKGLPIPAHGHFLITGSAFGDGVASDDNLSNGLTDAASLRLRQNGANVDVVCYYHATDPASAGGFLLPDLFQYSCEGIALANPHDDTTGTNTDSSLERKPGGGAGNCTDSGDNYSDFVAQAPSTPKNTHDPPAP